MAYSFPKRSGKEFMKMNINLLQATASGCYAVTRANRQKRCSELMQFVYNDFIKNNADKVDGVIICGNWVSALKDTTQIITDLRNTLAYLDKAGIKSIIIGQNETFHQPYPYVAARENEYNVSIAHKYLTRECAKINDVLVRNFNDRYVDVYHYGKIPKPVNNVPFMSDRNHLSKYGARLAMVKIMAHEGFKNMLD